MKPKIFRHREQRCGKCNKPLDSSSAYSLAADPKPPGPGDFTVCIHCAAILQFDGEMNLVLVGGEEMARLRNEERDSFDCLMATKTAVIMADIVAKRAMGARWN